MIIIKNSILLLILIINKNILTNNFFLDLEKIIRFKKTQCKKINNKRIDNFFIKSLSILKQDTFDIMCDEIKICQSCFRYSEYLKKKERSKIIKSIEKSFGEPINSIYNLLISKGKVSNLDVKFLLKSRAFLSLCLNGRNYDEHLDEKDQKKIYESAINFHFLSVEAKTEGLILFNKYIQLIDEIFKINKEIVVITRKKKDVIYCNN